MFKQLILFTALVFSVLSTPFDLTECGVTKGCYIPKDQECYNGCNEMGFTYKFLDPTHMRMEIFGKANLLQGFYYAVGFSYDEYMGDDYVIECSSLGKQAISMKYSFNVQVDKNPPTNIRVQNEDKYSSNFKNRSVSTTDGYVYCAADVDISGSPDNSQIFKFNSSILYYLFMANGPTNETGLLHHVHDSTSVPTNLEDVRPNFDTNSCGTYKRCFIPKEDKECSNGNPGLMISYNLLDNEHLQVEIVGKSASSLNHYVAVGFSDNPQSGQEAVIECSSIGGNPLSMKFSKTVGGVNTRIPNEEKLRSQFLDSKSVYQEGNLFCTGTILLTNNTLFDVNLNTLYFPSGTFGSTTATGLTKYDTRCVPEYGAKLSQNNANENRDKCGVDKGCFVPQCYEGCNGMSFNYKVSDDNTTMLIELTRAGNSPNTYVAVGFSLDVMMGDESVIECSDMGDGYTVRYSYNEGSSPPKNVRITSEEKYRAELISQQVLIQSDGTLYCSATVSLKGDPKEPRVFKYDSTQAYYFLLASGQTKNGVLRVHDHTAIADQAVLLTEKLTITPEAFDCSSCGVTKGCYFPEGNGNDCDGHGFSYSWVNNSHLMEVELILTPSTGFGYIAIGFSDDGAMGNESVIECSQLPGQDYSMKFSYNNEKRKNVRIGGEEKVRSTYITSTSYSERDGYVYCKGLVRVDGNDNKEIFQYNSSQPYYLLLARGTTSDDGLNYHTRAGRFVTDQARSLQNYTVPLSPTDAPAPSQVNCGECSKSYGCYFPDDSNGCTGKGITYKLLNDSYLQLQMVAPSSFKYIALGFSSDDKMGDDNVIECSSIGSAGYSMKFSYNQKSAKYNIRIDNEESIESTYFTDVVTRNEDGILYCSATVRINGWDKDSRVFHYTHGAKYHLLLAAGPTSSEGLSSHSSNKAVSGIVDISSTAKIKGMSEKTKHSLILAHAMLMILSWCCFVPTALVFARFLRNSWPLVKPGGLLIWFHVHRTANLLGIACMIASFACILTANSWKWTGPGSSSSKWGQTHTMTGLLALILAWMQPFISTMRCSPSTPNRFIFNWIHRGIGVLSYTLATTALSIAAFHFTSLWSNTTLQLSLSLIPIFLILVLCVVMPVTTSTTNEEALQKLRERIVFVFIALLVAVSITLCILVGVN